MHDAIQLISVISPSSMSRSSSVDRVGSPLTSISFYQSAIVLGLHSPCVTSSPHQAIPTSYLSRQTGIWVRARDVDSSGKRGS